MSIRQVQSALEIDVNSKESIKTFFGFIRDKQIEPVRRYISLGFNLESRCMVHHASVRDWTALLWAIYIEKTIDSLDLVHLLLDSGANVNQSVNDGMTPLYLAAYIERESLVRLLLASGADTTVKYMGEDCLDAASNREVRHLIVDHRAAKERRRLIDIGLAFAAVRVPILQLVLVYEAGIEFAEQRVSYFNCWQILRAIKSHRV